MTIFGLEKDTSVLKILREVSEFKFHLSGSKFFGYSNKKSDTDLFVQDSTQVRRFLQHLGFKPFGGRYYGIILDQDACDVYRLREGKSWIDVQLSKDFEARIKAHKLAVSAKVPWVLIPKKQRYLVWNILFAAVRQIG